jgi:hypothetical protein
MLSSKEEFIIHTFRKKEEKLLGQFLVNKIIAIIVYFKDRAS